MAEPFPPGLVGARGARLRRRLPAHVGDVSRLLRRRLPRERYQRWAIQAGPPLISLPAPPDCETEGAFRLSPAGIFPTLSPCQKPRAGPPTITPETS